MKEKLNLGSGYNKLEGWHNVDHDALSEPDEVVDLEVTPWPWESDSVTNIRLVHTLEHLGETSKKYLEIWKEIYRIAKPGAVIEITVPHFRHSYFANDPTHVRAITPEGLAMFDQAFNLEGIRRKNSDTKLGLQIEVDFKITNTRFTVDELWIKDYAAKDPTNESVAREAHMYNNVCEEISIMLEAVKPPRVGSIGKYATPTMLAELL